MFTDIKPKRLKGLLSPQSEVLKRYCADHLATADIALQLPTGSGKTLVGILLAEWRRRKFKERVVYLCPTNQLVNQVALYATRDYGIRVLRFTGSRYDYNPEAEASWLNGSAVAITNYSSLFNANPFFANPNVIVCDDAHAAESFIAGTWTLSIGRDEYPDLFRALTGIFEKYLDAVDVRRFTTDSLDLFDRTWVDQIPLSDYRRHHKAIALLFDEYLTPADTSARKPPEWYAWQRLQQRLDATHLYVGSREIAIRPIIAPTFSHAAFTGAKQRVYMSATLGEGGELERLMGRAKISRLPIPEGWDTHGIGRRFFMFPNYKEDDAQSLCLKLMEEAGRTLFLVPSDVEAARVSEVTRNAKIFEIFGSKQIEDSKEAFIHSALAVAVMANRYDGVDFPDAECRLSIVEGMPSAINLQERFFIQKLGAIALLDDRIRTRVVQAFGRCTRSPNDYSAVVVLGGDLKAFLFGTETRHLLHRELQAEIEYGILQSENRSPEEFLLNFRAFLEQESEDPGKREAWREAESGIIKLRDQCETRLLPSSSALALTAPTEVEYAVSMWKGDYAGAFAQCRKILAALTDPALAGYRALWHYLAGSAAFLAVAHNQGDLSAEIRPNYLAVRKTAPVAWPPHDLEPASFAGGEADPSLVRIIDQLQTYLGTLGLGDDRQFAKIEREICEGLRKSESGAFEIAHEKLGRLLGYESGRIPGQGAPDPYWIASGLLVFVFEDHSDGEAGGQITIHKARQATTHDNSIREHVAGLAENAEVVKIVVTPAHYLDDNAVQHMRDVYLWPLDEFREWAFAAVAAVREMRETLSRELPIEWRIHAIEEYKRKALDPIGIRQRVKQRVAAAHLKPWSTRPKLR